MNILFLTVMPSPYQRQLFACLAENGMNIEVLYFTWGAHDRVWGLPELAKYEKVMCGRTLSKVGGSAHWNPAVMKHVSESSPELVVVSDYSAPTAQVAMRGLARRGVPFIFWGEVPGFSKRGRLGTFLRNRLQGPLSHSAAIAAIGRVAVDAYEAKYPRKPIANIPYFCDLTHFKEARSKRRKKKVTIDILFSGQLIRRKGVDVLIDAFSRIAEEHSNVRMLLLGNGPDREILSKRVPPGLRDRVVFLGHKDPNDLPEFFASADIFCLPSRHDGWGVVVNEALGAGLPIIVSDKVGAGRDLVDHGVNGFVTPVGDVEALAQAIDQLVSDDAMRARFASVSAQLAEKWDVAEGARRWSQLFASVLSETSRQ